MKTLKKQTQYLSKWRGTWKYFKDSFGNVYQPNEVEIKHHYEYNYQIRYVEK